MGRRWSLGHSGRFCSTTTSILTPGIIRSKGIVLGQTEAGASTDHAIVKANEGISVVEVDNGLFATYTALNRSSQSMERRTSRKP
jgi:hypothetical protein